MQWTDPLVLRIHKPADISSYDIIRKFKRTLPKSVKKIGYYGTLDPFAEGLLLIALNQANRLTQFVHQDLAKTYVAKGVLGIETPTQDLTVEVTQKDNSLYFETVLSTFDRPFYAEQLKSFVGRYMQAPPTYSAAKFQGKKLCDWIRNEGIEIKKDLVEREIHDLKILAIEFPHLTFEVQCSSGTYIRSLFVDMAHKIGTIGCLKTLLRTQIGSIKNNQDCTFENWDPDRLENNSPFIVSIVELLPYPIITVNPIQTSDFMNGRIWEVASDQVHDESIYWVKNDEGKILGLAKQDQKKSKVLVGLH